MSTIPNGYKLTEVGVIPSDWEVKTISEISRPVRGGSPRPAGDLKYFNGDFIPWLTVAALTNIPISQIYVSETENHLTQLGALYSRILEKETLIIANSGATLGVAKLLAIRCCANDGIAALLDFDKKTNKKYLVHFINTKIKYLREVVASGNGQPNLNTELIGNIKAPFPPNKDEQTAIANTLSDADALITQLEKLIDKKRNIKQGAMQELLRPKEGWERKTLLELADYKKELFDDGDWIEAEHITNKGIRLIQTGNIGIGCFVEKDNKKYILEKSFYTLKCKPLVEGDLLICRLAEPAGRACVLPNIKEREIVTSVDVTIFRPRNEVVNRVFLVNVFSTSEWFSKVIERVGGTTHKRISRSSLGKIEVVLPKIEEQTRIAQILTDMDAEIEQLEKKLEKYKMMKQGMMQNLLTGKIRLV